ncbi:MAG: Crp/Fnr family transcriptional regulator [Elusimicrobia bacterium]|nr:Crp/Fnr family transcriptional regulator [Elusimicrobiota bacterium]
MTLSLLRRSPLLRALPPTALRRVLRIARWQDFSMGADVFSKTDLASHMFIVAQGRIKIFTASGGKKRKTFAYLGPGKFFGEMALLDGRERSASAQAVEESRLLLIPKRDFLAMLARDRGLSLHLLRTLSDRLRQANEEIEGLMFRNVLGRVSKTLVTLASQSGRRFRGGMLVGAKYTHQELADLVGTTREPLSRALAALRRAELVEMRHGQFFLRNPRKMRQLVGDISASSS